MLRRINRVLPEVLIGIILFGLVVQITGVWFVIDKLRYSTGLWIGIILAIGMVIHMAVVLEDAVSLLSEKRAKNKIIVQYILRYTVVVIVVVLVLYFKLGNMVTLFIGVMGLKVGAYLQPITHKVMQNLIRR